MQKVAQRLKANNEKDAILEIKALVDQGIPVYCDNEAYQVIKTKYGQYQIQYQYNAYCVNLHGLPGTPYEHDMNTDYRNVFFYAPCEAETKVIPG